MKKGQYSDKIEMFNIFKAITIILCLIYLFNYRSIAPTKIIHVCDPKFTLRSPYNSTWLESDDVYHQLIDLHNFSFKINPQPCKGYDAGLFLIIIISSNPRNYKKRSVIRKTWGRSIDSTKVVFLFGDTNNSTLSRLIMKESEEHGDIVQGNFIDAYRNMTYKHIMGLKWVSHHCPMAKYVLKTDDDVLVNSYALREFLAKELSPWGATDLIACEIMKHSEVQRSPKSKWMVTEEEYAGKYYPTYCAGWSILYSQDVVNRILTVSRSIPYFWIDDVHITGVIAEMIKVHRTPFASLVLTEMRANMLTSWGPLYTGWFLFGPPDLTTDRISQIWKAIPK